jgi:hypothetical protein
MAIISSLLCGFCLFYDFTHLDLLIWLEMSNNLDETALELEFPCN